MQNACFRVRMAPGWGHQCRIDTFLLLYNIICILVYNLYTGIIIFKPCYIQNHTVMFSRGYRIMSLQTGVDSGSGLVVEYLFLCVGGCRFDSRLPSHTWLY